MMQGSDAKRHLSSHDIVVNVCAHAFAETHTHGGGRGRWDDKERGAMEGGVPPAAAWVRRVVTYARHLTEVRSDESPDPGDAPRGGSGSAWSASEVFRVCRPSVVHVQTVVVRGSVDPFGDGREEMPQGSGSGVIWDTLGHVVTNHHVVASALTGAGKGPSGGGGGSGGAGGGASSSVRIHVTCVTGGGGDKDRGSKTGTFLAKIVGGDPDRDVAVLKLVRQVASDAGPRAGMVEPEGSPADGLDGLDLEDEDAGVDLDGENGYERDLAGRQVGGDIAEAVGRLRPMRVGKSRDLQVGQPALVIGNPFGLDHTLSVGVVSGLGREMRSRTGRPIQGIVQTDAAINPGNSGGPVLDAEGRLIGLATAIVSPSGAFAGIGFAIPVDAVADVVHQVLRTGRVAKPALGVTLAPDAAAARLGVRGALVLRCPRASPAGKAGVRPTWRDRLGRLHLGDLIVRVGTKPVANSLDLVRHVDACKVGDTVVLTLLRPDAPRTTPEPADPESGLHEPIAPRYHHVVRVKVTLQAREDWDE